MANMEGLERFLDCPASGMADVRLDPDGTLLATTTSADAHWTLKTVGLDNQYVRLTMKVTPAGTVQGQSCHCRLGFQEEGMNRFDQAHILTQWVQSFDDYHTYTFKCIPFQLKAIKRLRLFPVNHPGQVAIRSFEVIPYERFDPEAAACPPTSDLGLILLSYYSRTGSTLAMKVLTRHPQITGHTGGTRDANILKYFSKLYFMFLTSHIPSGPKRDDRFLDRFRRFSLHYRRDYALTKPVEFDSYVHLEPFRQHFSRFVLDYLPQLLADMGAPHLSEAKYYVEKQMDSGRLLRSMLDLFPRAKIVAAFRDPRDVVVSLLAFQKKERIVKKDEQTPVTLVDEIMQTYAARLALLDEDPARGVLYRYEDLLGEPHETIRTVVKFLGLDNTDEIIDHMAGALARKDLQADRHMTAKGVSQTIGRWEKELPRKCVEQFKQYSPIIDRLGYPV